MKLLRIKVPKVQVRKLRIQQTYVRRSSNGSKLIVPKKPRPY